MTNCRLSTKPRTTGAAGVRFRFFREGAAASCARALCAATLVLFLSSCASGPSAPQPGTPPFFWGAAGETWRSGDYLKTLDNLSQLTANQNEFTVKARPWEIIVATGIARGYMDLADAAETAMRKSPARANPIRRQMTVWRGSANSMALELADTFQKFATANKETSVSLEFSWPPVGSAASPTQLERFASGTPLSVADVEGLETAMIQRGVMLAAARVTGSGEDTAKAQEIFKQPKPSVPAETLLVNMGQVFYDLSALYGPRKLDTPQRGDMMITLATMALKPYPRNKTAAGLLQRIQKGTKAKK